MGLKINGFIHKKHLVGVNGPCWTQNYSVSSKLRIHGKDILKFSTLKGAKGHMKIMLMSFGKKVSFGENESFTFFVLFCIFFLVVI